MENIFKGFLLIISVLLIVAVYTLVSAETLTWDRNPDAVTYEIFVREKGHSTYNPVATGVTGTSIEVTPPTNNRTYEYFVTAVNECGIKSDYSNPVEYNRCLSSTVQKVGNLRVTITVNVQPEP